MLTTLLQVFAGIIICCGSTQQQFGLGFNASGIFRNGKQVEGRVDDDDSYDYHDNYEGGVSGRSGSLWHETQYKEPYHHDVINIHYHIHEEVFADEDEDGGCLFQPCSTSKPCCSEFQCHFLKEAGRDACIKVAKKKCIDSGQPCGGKLGSYCCEHSCHNEKCQDCLGLGNNAKGNNPCKMNSDCCTQHCGSGGNCVNAPGTCVKLFGPCTYTPCCAGFKCGQQPGDEHKKCYPACIKTHQYCPVGSKCCNRKERCLNGKCIECLPLRNLFTPLGLCRKDSECCSGSCATGQHAGQCQHPPPTCLTVGSDCTVNTNKCCSGLSCSRHEIGESGKTCKYR